jgi:Ras-related protein Rab-8A
MEQVKKPENQIKLLLLGDQAVGKSSLMMRYSDDIFNLSTMGTAGLDLKRKNIKIENENIKVMIYDTAGHDRYRLIAKSQYKGSEGIILVYDVTDKKSFDNVSYWMNHIKENADTGVEILLVGNKIDIDNRAVNPEEGEALGIKYSVLFAETSAKTGDNVESAFLKLITNIYHKEKAKVAPITQINNKDKKKPSKCC